jgi:hypothetical protein
MFKKLLDFFKNLFKPRTKKYEGENPYKYDYNTKPQDETWKDKMDEKLADLESRLEDDSKKKVSNPSPSPQPKPIDPIINNDFSVFMELVDMLMGRGFVELSKGTYILKGPNHTFEVSLMDRKITKTMGLTTVSASFSTGHEGVLKVERFLSKHMM